MKVLTYPDAFLRQKSEIVTLPLSNADRELIEDMRLTMYKENGVGLAAVQIGFNKRICVIDISPSKANPIVMIRRNFNDERRMFICSRKICRC